jgi:hypothetical protein
MSFTAASFKMSQHELRQHNTVQWHGPIYPHFSTHNNRIMSFATWPAISKQTAENLSYAGFFYTGSGLNR